MEYPDELFGGREMDLNGHFLATTAIADFWDIEKDILFLGPWCVPGVRKNEPVSDKDCRFIQSPWMSWNKLEEASKFCLNAYRDIMPTLAEQLNRLHGLDHPQRYWSILIGPWLLHFIEILYDRYMRIDGALTLFPGISTFTLPRSMCDLTAKDTRDSLTKLAADDFYNLKLISLAMYCLYPASAIVKDLKICLPERKASYRKNLLKGICYEAKKIKNIFVKPRIVLSDMYHYSCKQMLRMELVCMKQGISFEYFDNPAQENNTQSGELRERISFEKHSDKFQSLLRSVMPRALPLCYVENFKECKDRVRVNEVRAIGSSVGWYFNENFKFLAAESLLIGAKLLSFQYGGGYGMTVSNATDAISLESDIFYTWGRSLASNAKVLPSPYLAGLMNSHLKKGNDLLFVATSIPQYVYRLYAALLPENILKYGRDEVDFLRHLSEDARNKLIYKSYTQDYGRSEEKIIKAAFPGLKSAGNKKAVDLMKRAKLVVVDHPHTSFVEALTINVPSVFYWDHEVYLMRPDAEEYFNLLRSAGILYKDPVSAAKKVNKVFDDPMDWWLKKEVQDARSKFCEHFAYTRKDWADVWSREFNNIA